MDGHWVFSVWRSFPLLQRMLLWALHAGLLGCCIAYPMIHSTSPQSSVCWTIILCFPPWFWRDPTGQFLPVVSPQDAASCQLGWKEVRGLLAGGHRSCLQACPWGWTSSPLPLPRGSHPRQQGFPHTTLHFLFSLLAFSCFFLPHDRPCDCLQNVRPWVWKSYRNTWVSMVVIFL